MPVGDYAALQALSPEVRFVEADRLLLPVKSRKSESELELYRDAVEIADVGFEVIANMVEAGKTEAELVAAAENAVRKQGAVHTIIQVLSGQMYTRLPTVRRLQTNQMVCCYVEVVGPYGFWVEKGGMFALGTPPERSFEIYAGCVVAAEAAERSLRPGQQAGAVASEIYEIAADVGCRIGIQVGHGVGIDHDLPLLVPDDATTLEPGMVVSVHPHLHDETYGAMVMDQYTITTGAPTKHSRIERKLFEV
jgi:Xaa-Pro aminopeptidase